VKRDGVKFIAQYALAEATALEFSLIKENEDDWDDRIVRSLSYLPSVALLGILPDIPEVSGAERSHLDCLQQTLRVAQMWKSGHSKTNGNASRFSIYAACYLIKGEYLMLLLPPSTALFRPSLANQSLRWTLLPLQDSGRMSCDSPGDIKRQSTIADYPHALENINITLD
jgi:hypothetical protein